MITMDESYIYIPIGYMYSTLQTLAECSLLRNISGKETGMDM